MDLSTLHLMLAGMPTGPPAMLARNSTLVQKSSRLAQPRGRSCLNHAQQSEHPQHLKSNSQVADADKHYRSIEELARTHVIGAYCTTACCPVVLRTHQPITTLLNTTPIRPYCCCIGSARPTCEDTHTVSRCFPPSSVTGIPTVSTTRPSCSCSSSFCVPSGDLTA